MDPLRQPTQRVSRRKLTGGSKIIGAERTRGQIWIWTDTSLHSMTFRGPPHTFGFRELATGCGPAGPLAAAEVGGIRYWMGVNQFFAFDGSVRPIIGPVNNFAFEDLNSVQIEKVVAGLDKEYTRRYSGSTHPPQARRTTVIVSLIIARTSGMSGRWTGRLGPDASTSANNIGAGADGYLYSRRGGHRRRRSGYGELQSKARTWTLVTVMRLCSSTVRSPTLPLRAVQK